MSNTQIAKKQVSFTAAIGTEGYKKLINNTLRDTKRAARFTSALTSAVVNNPTLSECTNESIVSAALLGEGLNLSPSPQLGQYYLVPFNKKGSELKVAQFQLGYKGYIQLAIRSGQYKKLIVTEVKEGELISFNPLTEDIEISLIDDVEEREKAQTIGYYAMFEYLNGFRKALYWKYDKMLSHADKYSAAFSKDIYQKIQEGKIPEKDMWKYSSFWYKSFDEMAKKTMLRQLISKWGIMSIEMQDAFEKDMAVIGNDGKYEYVDSTADEVIVQGEPTEETESVNINEL